MTEQVFRGLIRGAAIVAFIICGLGCVLCVPFTASTNLHLLTATGVYFVAGGIMIVGGLITNSLALLADAGHMFSDVVPERDDVARTALQYHEASEDVNRRLRECDALLRNPAVFGYCYTQLTDVFQEQNGIYGFDRRANVLPPLPGAITSHAWANRSSRANHSGSISHAGAVKVPVNTKPNQ